LKKLRHKVSINTDRSSGGRLISSKSLPVRGARHARVAFDVLSPPGTDLIIQHLRGKQLLARERRPLAAGTSNLEIKSHPESSDIACSLEIAGRPIDGVRFSVDCGRRIEPVARHFIVIGAMKAGTTTLFELLKQHPALCPTFAEVPGVSFIKEINYFRDLYRKKHRPVHYDWRFPFEPATHAWTLDVSPAYAKWPGSRAVPARIASLGGKIKLAYLLREPVDRAESHLAHSLQFHGQRAKLQHCIRTSCYAMQLDKFTRHLPRKDSPRSSRGGRG
jgi:hypothetical protein